MFVVMLLSLVSAVSYSAPMTSTDNETNSGDKGTVRPKIPPILNTGYNKNI